MPILQIIGAVITLVIILGSYFALRTCARELTAIRTHLDKLSREALTHLKNLRRTGSA